MTNDEKIKIVFDNLRNFFLTVSLITVGGAVVRFRDQLDLQPWLAFLILIIFTMLSAFLLVWNGVHGITQFTKSKKMVIVIPALLVYMSMAVIAWHALPLLNLKVISAASTSTTKNDN